MKGVLRNALISVGIACLAYFGLSAIGSNYIFDFLKANLVNIQIGLLAINTATLGVVLTKLRDLVDSGVPMAAFARARSEMLLSIKEQVALIVAALTLLSLNEAKAIRLNVPTDLLQILLIACFAYSLLILYDTAKSVFVVLGESPES
ncbi:MAG: hypothetical protein EOP90_05495 [Lysobacteraceae bacterium]|nr:MAG: hypothetical protein EOP90_05495 [Xanthomonadaceae bacterium]